MSHENGFVSAESNPMSVSFSASHDTTVSLRVVQQLIDIIEQTGVPRSAIASALGETVVAVTDADARISSREVERICELALDLTGDQALGLLWAAGLTERTFAPVSQLVGFAGSLRESLELLSDYQRLFCDRSFYQLSEHGELATLRLFADWEFSSRRMSRLAAEMAVAGFLVVIRFFDPRVALARVWAPHFVRSSTRRLLRKLDTCSATSNSASKRPLTPWGFRMLQRSIAHSSSGRA